MTDLLHQLQDLPNWQSAIAAALATGLTGMGLSRLSWVSGHFWAITKRTVAQRGISGLFQSFLIPLLLDVVLSPRYLLKSVGLRDAPAKVDTGDVIPFKELVDGFNGPTSLRELLDVSLSREGSIVEFAPVTNAEGRFLVLKVRVAKEDAPWML